MFYVFASIAEFEWEPIWERAIAGLESARARGRHGGRPQALDEGKAKLARRLKDEGDQLVEEIYPRVGRSAHRHLGEDHGGNTHRKVTASAGVGL